PWNVGEPREPGGRREGQELKPGGRLRVEVDDLALQVLALGRVDRPGKGEGRRRCGCGDRIEAEVPLGPCSIDDHPASLLVAVGRRGSAPPDARGRQIPLSAICQGERFAQWPSSGLPSGQSGAKSLPRETTVPARLFARSSRAGNVPATWPVPCL